MTLSGLLLGWPVLSGYGRTSSAVSDEAGIISKAADMVGDSAQRSQVIYGMKAALSSDLIHLAMESIGDGTETPISSRTLSAAMEFVRAMPSSWPPPEFAIEPDGGISIDWVSSPHRQLSISVSERRRIAFAWQDGSNRGHGVAQFDGLRVPREIDDLRRAIVSNENPSIRTF